ncbi:hypothetical protein [Maricaulis sp.]|uniref:hypothetical protein n=1 Tax=Maricaulis sp. TaxID=1486257 RepID=UPI002B2654E0|nr:hypothetical protein [Maricaulis sp.]
MFRNLTALGALVVLAGCASGPRGQDDRPASGFESAARLVDQGRYSEALPILRCIAVQGEGFEIAQFLAGHSAMAMSELDTTPAILRDDMRIEGFERLAAAGNAGWPAAQAELATAYAGIGTEQAHDEAAYWAAVYRRNTRERAYGLDRLDNQVEAEINARLDETRRQNAAALADAFTPTPLERGNITPECAPFIRSARGGAQGREGQRGRGSGGRGGGQGGGRPGGGDRGLTDG